jgi:hypothetical protein
MLIKVMHIYDRMMVCLSEDSVSKRVQNVTDCVQELDVTPQPGQACHPSHPAGIVETKHQIQKIIK